MGIVKSRNARCKGASNQLNWMKNYRLIITSIYCDLFFITLFSRKIVAKAVKTG